MATLEPTLPMPPLQELDSMFTELVVSTRETRVNDPILNTAFISSSFLLSQDELDLTEEHRANMFALPAAKKWQIYCSKKMVRNENFIPDKFKCCELLSCCFPSK